MAKYLILWETEWSKWPTDPKEQAALMGKQMELTKQGLDEGRVTDWGIYAGAGAGYAITEGTAVDALRGATQYMPYVKFQVHPVLSINEVAELMKSMMG